VHRFTRLLVVGLVVTLAAGISASATSAAPAVAAKAKLGGSITVSAAASLTEAFTQIGKDFEKRNRGTTVTFNFGASSALVQQIQGGAPADVFASADTANMLKLQTAHLTIGYPQEFARNQLEIVVKPGNPKHVTGVEDLLNVGTVALCAASVPCGSYAGQVLTNLGVALPADHVTRGQDAKATLAAVAAGDAEAGIVYVTDALSAGKTVTRIAIPAMDNIVASYPIAALRGSDAGKLATAFVKYVLSAAGQRTLGHYGFIEP
jgi:molybdate transport system substrate-binding protein